MLKIAEISGCLTPPGARYVFSSASPVFSFQQLLGALDRRRLVPATRTSRGSSPHQRDLGGAGGSLAVTLQLHECAVHVVAPLPGLLLRSEPRLLQVSSALRRLPVHPCFLLAPRLFLMIA